MISWDRRRWLRSVWHAPMSNSVRRQWWLLEYHKFWCRRLIYRNLLDDEVIPDPSEHMHVLKDHLIQQNCGSAATSSRRRVNIEISCHLHDEQTKTEAFLSSGRSVVPSLSGEDVREVYRDASVKMGKDPDIRGSDGCLTVQSPHNTIRNDGVEISEHWNKVGPLCLELDKWRTISGYMHPVHRDVFCKISDNYGVEVHRRLLYRP